MKKTFNWAILGAGRIAHKFATDLQRIDGARLYAVASRSQQRAQAFADTYQAPHALGSYEALTQLEGIDAVYVATRHVYHAECSILCLQAGLPVLCEKPFAMNAEEVRRMIATAQQHQTYLMEAFWTRFIPHMQKVLSLIEKGAIGTLNSVKADFGFAANYDPEGRLFNKQLGGGSLLDIGIYPVFLSLLLFGKPTRIRASALMGNTQVDEVCAMVLDFPDNKIAMLHSTILNDTSTEAFIYGSEGYIHIQRQWHKLSIVSLHRRDEPVQTFQWEDDSFGYHYEARAVMSDLANLSAQNVEASKKTSITKIENDLMPHAMSLLLIETLDAIRAEAGIVY